MGVSFRSIRATALKIPGVHAVITAKDMPGGPPIVPMRLQPLPEFKPFEQPVIAHDKVRYVGEPMAVVIADSVAIGEDALEAIEVEIDDPLDAVADWHVAQRDKSLLFEGPGTNRSLTFNAVRGDADAAFRERALCAARDAPYWPPLRPHHGAARVHGRVGRGQGPADGLGRGQGAVLQPPHPRQADRPRGRRHRDDRE